MSHRLAQRRGVAALCLLAACGTEQITEPLDSPSLKSTASSGPALLHVASATPGILGTFGGVTVYQSGYGSAIAAVPGQSRWFWLLTDRGPNIDGPGGSKVFPDPTYTPRLYKGHVAGSKLRITDELLFRRSDGTPLTGLPIPIAQCGSTGETALRLDGTTINPDPSGIDSEGLVALDDGTFWVSDEYGPFLAHFGSDGREIERLSPCNGGLPEVYKLRRPNRGMEGLTITPDGQWLVGIMQAPLENPTSAVRGVSRLTRVLFKNLATGATKEYAYLLERANLQGNSEIVALSNTKFLVIERDGDFLFGPTAATFKRIYQFEITSNATDISTLGALGATPIAGGKTLEEATDAELLTAGIVPVTKALAVDLLASGYPHDKVEGLALLPGNMLFVTNDDDFGINGLGTTGTLIQKLLPPSTTEPDVSSVWQFRLR